MATSFSRRQIVKFGGGALLAGCGQWQAAMAKPSTSSWIPDEQKESIIRCAMQKHQVPGVGIAVVEDGLLAWQGGFGLANIVTGASIDDTTLFQAASLTKPLFAYVVLRLVDAGQMDLDERLVDTFLPSDLMETDWNNAITVRHVLSHQTGLPNWRSANDEAAPLQAAFAPGTAYSYSGEAFHWLQQVCETKTGLGLHDLVDQYLFTPAGLTDMAMLWLDYRDDREVFGHVIGENGEAILSDLQFDREHGRRLHEVAIRWDRPMRSWRSEDLQAAHAAMRPHNHPRLAGRPLWRMNRPGSAIISSASSLRTTAADYARFLTLMMGEVGPASIADDLRQEMLSVQTEASDAGQNRPNGFAWALERVDGGVAYDHWGFNAGQYISMALGDTASRKGIVMMTNGSQGNKFMDEIGPILTGVNYQSFF